MTRETKIGLLVGLAFIIVIGILLEDHFSGLQKPQPAPLQNVGANVRTGAGMPGAPATPRQPLPADPSLQHPVPTTRDLTQMALARRVENGISRVDVGPANSGGRPGEAVLPLPGDRRTETRTDQPRADQRRGESDLERVARRFGEEIVRVDGGRPEERRADGAPPAARTYTAEAGDNLSKIAAKLLGTNNKANREAIIKLNPSLQADPNKIVVGKTYNIPALAGSTPAPSPAPAPAPAPTVTRVPAAAPAPPPVVARVPTPAPAPSPAEGSYTTKAGDTLWRIAVEQCGAASARAQIVAMNRDVLTNPDLIPVGVKLRLPPKVVAAAR